MQKKDFQLKANTIRKHIVEMLNSAGSGHSAGSLGMADIFTVLYFKYLKHNPKKPEMSTRDFVFLSNGHICPVLYATLAECGYFSTSELSTLRKLGSPLQGHPHRDSDGRGLSGVENSGGPLGQGVSQAAGLAWTLKREGKKNNVFCFMGDGELEEGQCWEAFMLAGAQRLDNLIVIVDRNYIQIDGNTEDVVKLDPLSKKFQAFNFATIEFDGNDITQISHAIKHAIEIKNKPVCLIAKTTPGKGVSFMENDYHWHGKTPNDEEAKKALEELEKDRRRIEK